MERKEQERRGTSDLSDAVKLEYNYLRERLLQNARIRIQIFGISIAAVGVSMSIGIANKSFPVFLAPIGILLASLYYTIGSFHVINRIATYIRCFLESPETGLQWETRLARFRETDEIKKGGKAEGGQPQGEESEKKVKSFVRWLFDWTYHVLIGANFALFVWYLPAHKLPLSIILIIIWFLNFFWSRHVRTKYRKEKYQDYLSRWQKIKKAENNKKG